MIAAAHIILALQTIVSREVDPLETAVVSCCSLQAGDPRAQSVCPDSCQIVGTARTFSPDVRDLVEKRIGEISASIAAGLGCTAETDYGRFYPPCINTPEQAAFMADVAAGFVGEENVDRNYPRMAGGEDFASYWKRFPVLTSELVRAALLRIIRTLTLTTRFFLWQPALWRQQPKRGFEN